MGQSSKKVIFPTRPYLGGRKQKLENGTDNILYSYIQIEDIYLIQNLRRWDVRNEYNVRSVRPQRSNNWRGKRRT